MLTGETIDAATALSIGLATKVVPHDTLMQVAMEFALRIARTRRSRCCSPCARRAGCLEHGTSILRTWGTR